MNNIKTYWTYFNLYKQKTSWRFSSLQKISSVTLFPRKWSFGVIDRPNLKCSISIRPIGKWTVTSIINIIGIKYRSRYRVHIDPIPIRTGTATLCGFTVPMYSTTDKTHNILSQLYYIMCFVWTFSRLVQSTIGCSSADSEHFSPFLENYLNGYSEFLRSTDSLTLFV